MQQLVGILVRPDKLLLAQKKSLGRFLVTVSISELLDFNPGSVVECAGHSAVLDYGLAVAHRNIDFIISSVGALSNESFASNLIQAYHPPARLLIPSGAVAGLDGLLAARSAGIASITYTSVKPLIAWADTAAEEVLRASASSSASADRTAGAAITIFEGSAREAAVKFPRNANVGAAVALAGGIGLDRTRVRLVADPAATGPLGVVEAAGSFGALRLETLALAAPSNPKTSVLTAHSLYVAAISRGAACCFALTPADLVPVGLPSAAATELAAAAAGAEAALAAAAAAVLRPRGAE